LIAPNDGGYLAEIHKKSEEQRLMIVEAAPRLLQRLMDPW